MSPVKKSSVWFLGTSAFAVPSLEALLADPSFSVDLVITQPDRPTGRKQELTPPPVKVTAMKHGLKILQPESLNKEFSTFHFPLSTVDFLIVVSFGQILSQEILDIATIAPINLHASLLPRWRGASPIQHAILSGDTETGVTVQKMVKELDAGPILAQESLTMDSRETAVTLHDTLAARGAKLLIKTLKAPLKPHEQDASGITVCHKLSREDGVCDPSVMTAEEIDRKVRGLTPWPAVTINALKVLESSLTATSDSTPLPCAQGTTLHLIKVQPAGKKAMSGAEWARGKKA